MITTLGAFIAELRAVGLPVSTAEALDAAAAIRHIDIGDRGAVREALAATMVKVPRHRVAFDTAFDVFFATAARQPEEAEGEHNEEADGGGAAAGGGGDAGEIMDALVAALQGGDRGALLAAVRRAVGRLSGFQAGRPVGGRYYLYRVMQRLEGIEALLDPKEMASGLEARLTRDEVQAMIELLRTELRREILRRLVADRGAEPVAQTLREPLVEDLDLMHATRPELERIEAAVNPLARKLATRLAQRRRMGRRGRLDVRRTIRRSLAHGGVMLEPRFRPPRRGKPEIVLLCDVSGSMATFARFTMQLTYAIGHQFSKVRAFAFVDSVDEVTGLFGPGTDFADSMARMSREARVVGHDGHSDYGTVWRIFAERHLEAVTPLTTLIITGDARNNYRDTEDEFYLSIVRRARAVFWLNPEAHRFWNTGDSVMGRYSPGCDAVYEVRTLRQLERFVETVALPGTRLRRRAVATP